MSLVAVLTMVVWVTKPVVVALGATFAGLIMARIRPPIWQSLDAPVQWFTVSVLLYTFNVVAFTVVVLSSSAIVIPNSLIHVGFAISFVVGIRSLMLTRRETENDRHEETNETERREERGASNA